MSEETVPYETEQPAQQAEPGKLELLLKSRKFWAALVGLVLVIVRAFVPDLPFSDEQIGGVVLVVVAYILGTAYEDGQKAKA